MSSSLPIEELHAYVTPRVASLPMTIEKKKKKCLFKLKTFDIIEYIAVLLIVHSSAINRT